ncbi:MAG: MlaD family protein [Candidatus Omnitrophota bacterium]
MTQPKWNLEFKVGIFTFIGLIILILSVFSINGMYILRPGYDIKVTFRFASGIAEGAPASVAGVQVGEVKKIILGSDAQKQEALITLWVKLKQGVEIPRDSQTFVSTMGLIGETYLEIIPGSDYAQLLQNGDTLTGRDPSSTDTVMEIVRTMAADFNQVLDSVNDILNEQTRNEVKATVHNISTFSEGLNDQSKQDLQQTLQNLREAAVNVKLVTGRLERGEGKIGAWIKPTARDISRRAEEAKEEERALQKLKEEQPTQ